MRLAVFAEVEIIGAAGGASPVYVSLAVTAVDFAGQVLNCNKISGAGGETCSAFYRDIYFAKCALIFAKRDLRGSL